MARNGSGTYSLPEAAFVNDTVIDEVAMNSQLSDIATALTESIARDGQTPVTAAVSFGTFGIEADVIAESTASAGVTIDSVLLKDAGIQLGLAGALVFEGATADAFETTLTVVDPTADRTVTIPDATTTMVGTDTTDTLTNKTLTSAVLNTGVSGTAVLDEDNMASDSATQVATQQSIKAYVDASGVAQANQAAIEAETNEDTYIPPDLIKHSPGMAKAWVMFNHTGTAAIRSSHNITSITDDGVGLATITIATDFSGADVYTAAGIAEEVSGSGCFVSIEDGTAPAAGTLTVAVYRDQGSLTDSARVGVVMFGDQ